MNHETPSVLLVDDDRDLLHLMSMRLTAAGYRVTAVEAAEAALASLAVQRPHLVITDLRMQGMDGLGLAIAREYVEAHGGRIALLAEGPGGHFRVTLPKRPALLAMAEGE